MLIRESVKEGFVKKAFLENTLKIGLIFSLKK